MRSGRRRGLVSESASQRKLELAGSGWFWGNQYGWKAARRLSECVPGAEAAFPRGLKRERGKGLVWSDPAKSIPQGLKPPSLYRRYWHS